MQPDPMAHTQIRGNHKTGVLLRILSLSAAALLLQLLFCCAIESPSSRRVDPKPFDDSPAHSTYSRYEYAIVVMGSRARIVVYAADDPVAQVHDAFESINAVDRALSDYAPSSESRRLAASPAGAWRETSPVLTDALAKSHTMWAASDGAFDITIGALSALWRRDTPEKVSEAEIEEARQRTGMDLLEFDPDSAQVRFLRDGMRLDFGGIGKGIAADAALASLRDAGFPKALIEIGGDVVVGDPPPGEAAWTLRVDHGNDHLNEILEIKNQAVATSGDSFRFTLVEGQRLSHLIESRSGIPIGSGTAVTVVARKGWIADGLATIAKLRSHEAAEAAAAHIDQPGFTVVRSSDTE